MTDDANELVGNNDAEERRDWAELFGGRAGWEGRLLPLDQTGVGPPPYYVLKETITPFGGQPIEVAYKFKLVGPSEDDDTAYRYELDSQIDPGDEFYWLAPPQED